MLLEDEIKALEAEAAMGLISIEDVGTIADEYADELEVSALFDPKPVKLTVVK